jgi:hypothetical protein
MMLSSDGACGILIGRQALRQTLEHFSTAGFNERMFIGAG